MSTTHEPNDHCPLEAYLALQKQRFAAISQLIGAIDSCAILRHRSQQRWQFILPDLDGGGRWRAQCFDVKGFSGHSVFISLAALLEEMIVDGFYYRDDNALDRVQPLESFKRGNFINDIVRQINSAQITMAEGNRLLENYDAGKR